MRPWCIGTVLYGISLPSLWLAVVIIATTFPESSVVAFVVTPPLAIRTPQWSPLSASPSEDTEATSVVDDDDGSSAANDMLQEILAMRASAIQSELKQMGISTADLFEKEGLVQRLLEARLAQASEQEEKAANDTVSNDDDDSNDGPPAVDPAVLLARIEKMRAREIKAELTAARVSTSGVFEKEELVKLLVQEWTTNPPGSKKVQVTTGPLFVSTTDGADTMDGFTTGAGQDFPTIQLEVQDGGGFNLNVLLDTACTGLIVQPNVIEDNGLETISQPISVTGAAGMEQTPLATQINTFRFGGDSFGPLLAVAQNIGSLPRPLQGILGLSFMSQFACVEMDFEAGLLNLYKKEKRPPVPEGRKLELETEMIPAAMGLYTLDISIDGWDKVKLLVDTGAGTSILSWEGIKSLGLSDSSPEVVLNSGNQGAMGADNTSMELTHSLPVTEKISIAGVDIPISSKFDIGSLPILDTTLAGTGVVGILGSNIFSKFALVRFSFQGPRFTFALLK